VLLERVSREAVYLKNDVMMDGWMGGGKSLEQAAVVGQRSIWIGMVWFGLPFAFGVVVVVGGGGLCT